MHFDRGRFSGRATLCLVAVLFLFVLYSGASNHARRCASSCTGELQFGISLLKFGISMHSMFDLVRFDVS